MAGSTIKRSVSLCKSCVQWIYGHSRLRLIAVVLVGLTGWSGAAHALTAQTITGFAPATPKTFSTGGTFSLSTTGGGSGNPVVFASTTTTVCTASGSTATMVKVGTCTLTANQAGNASYSAAPQVTKSVVINKGSQTITFGALLDKTMASAPFTVAATASSGLAVTFTSTTTTVCTVSGSTVTLVKPGTCIIAANQAGNTNFNAATQLTRSFAVAKGAQTISFAALTGKTMGTAPITVSATASSGLAVTFTSTTTPVCTVSGSTVTLVAAGTCTIAANQAGNTNYNAATQVTQSFTVSKAAQTISFAALAGKTMGAAPFTVSATASSGLAVTFTSTTTPVCTMSGSTVTLVSAGTCTIAANQAGNTNYNAAPQVTQSFSVAAGTTPQTITGFAPATPITYTNGGTITLTATGGASGNPVIFASTTTGVCTVAGSTATLIAAGTCTLTANQAGNASYSAAPQVTKSVVINKGTQTITFGVLANQRIGAAAFPVSATASSGLTVAFTSTTTPVCTASGSTVTLVAIGTCTIAVNQAGNTNFNTATPATRSFLVGQAVVSMALGGTHTCALTNVGGVKCWGGNAFGQLGDGSTSNRTTPVDVAGLTSGVVDVEAGYGFTCAITINGGVKCWGKNPDGQLGDGTNTDRSTPGDVTGLTSGVVALTLGFSHACALQAGGVVKCWGSNDYSESGDGTSTPHTTPVTVVGLGAPAIDVRAGSFYTCALLAGGGVQCWGYNSDGELGNGLLTNSAVPVNVSGLGSGMSAVESASMHTCSLTGTGGVKCWGANGNGQLGNGTTTSSLVPVDVSGLTSGVAAIAMGVRASCALTSGGGQKCWGGANNILTPQDIAGLTSGVVEIGVGGYSPDTSYCALTTTGAMLCWGSNSAGQLGDGTTTQRTTPAYVTGLTGGNAINQTISFAALPNKAAGAAPFNLSATASSGLAVTFHSITPSACTVSGVVVTLVASSGYCTIAADQSGNGGYNAAEEVTQSFIIGASGPQTITGFSPPALIAYSTGGTFTLSATGGASGNPVVYSSATSGVCTVTGNVVTIIGTGTCTLTANQAGNTNYPAAPTVSANVQVNPASATTPPTLITPNLPDAVISKAYTGSLIVNAAAALTTVTVSGLPAGMSALHNGSGTIALSGTPTVAGTFTITIAAANAYGSSNLTVPLQVGNKADSITAGSVHTCAVVNGGVMCWGRNTEGQLGNNSTSASSPPVPTFSAGSNVTAVAAGGTHTCAIVAGGVQCWGNNANGKLGNNSTTTSLMPVTAIAPGSNVAALSAGGMGVIAADYAGHTCAVVNGGIQCWGGNDAGQLGNNTNAASLVPITVLPASSGATAIAAGGSHTCAVINGGVKCWGKNDRGQLGNNSTVASAIPVVAIAAGSGVTAVSAGGSFSCALISGGVQCWGDNTRFQLLKVSQNVPFNPIPTQAIPPNSNVTAIASGDEHTCAVSGGGLQCWGDSSYLQLGSGKTTSWYWDDGRGQILTTAINLGNNVSGVAAGGGHTCAIVNGAVLCWGGNISGQIGNNQLQSYQTAPVAAIETGGKATTVVADGQSCATIDGGVQCWASNSTVVEIAAGSGVTGTTTGASCVVINGKVQCGAIQQVGSGASGVAASLKHSCAVANGGVQCWGAYADSNALGQFGNGSTTNDSVPVVAIPSGSNATSVSTGANYTCAAVNGGAQCWGGNTYGQLGNNGTVTSVTPVIAIATGSGVTAIAAGTFHSCAVVNGGVQCWGDNSRGQLGNNSSNTSSLTPVVAITAGSNATSVTVGYDHTCAVVAGGVQCWGNNDRGQLGNSSIAMSLKPVTAIAAGSNVTAVAATIYEGGGPCPSSYQSCEATETSYTCAVVNGGVVCWGDSKFGKLGNPGIYQLGNFFSAIALFSDPPTAPTITASTPGPGSATLIFTPPANNGGTPVTSYTATCSAAGYATVSTVGVPSANNITLTGMTGGIVYACSITARNVSGTGPASNVVTVTPTTAPPLAPTLNSATPGPASATLIFTLPASDGGAPITGFISTCTAPGNPAVSAANGLYFDTNVRTITLTGMIGGVSYTCSTTATNSAGTSPASNAMSVTPTIPTPPSAPVITSVAPGPGTATVNFTAPASNAATSYTATCTAAGYPVRSANVGWTSRSIVVIWLTGGVTYSCTVTTTDNIGTSGLSNAMSVTPTAAPGPTASIDSPTDNSVINAGDQVTIRAQVHTSTGTIAKIELFDGATVLKTYLPPNFFSAAASNVYTSFILDPLSLGNHAMSVKVTDSTGATAASSVVTLRVLSAPTVTMGVTGNFFMAPADIDLYVAATPAAGSNAAIVKVEYFASGYSIATVTTPPFSYRYSNVPVGTYGFRATVTDSLGASATSLNRVDVVVGNAPTITADDGLDGSTVNDDHMQISGTLQAPPNSAVSVNGRSGVVSSDGKFFINDVLLQPGSNTLTITITTIDGQTATQAITVNSTGIGPFAFSASKDSGFAPLTSNFSLTNRGNVAISRIEVSCNDNGSTDLTVTTVEQLFASACGYDTPGVYRARVKVFGGTSGQMIYTATQSLYAESVELRDIILRGVFNNLLSRLKVGNIAGALNSVTLDAKDRFNTIFTNIPDLPTAAAQLGVLKSATLSEYTAEYLLQRNGDNGVEGFTVNFVPGEDGIWRIDGM